MTIVLSIEAHGLRYTPIQQRVSLAFVFQWGLKQQSMVLWMILFKVSLSVAESFPVIASACCLCVSKW